MKRIKKFEQFRDDELLEEGIKDWILAGSIALSTLIPNSSLAQDYKNGDDDVKTTIINKLKSAKEKGDKKASELFSAIKNNIEIVNNVDIIDDKEDEFSLEELKKIAKDKNGVLGIGKSTDLHNSRDLAYNDAILKKNNNGNSKIEKEVVIRSEDGKYITYIVLI